MTRRCQSCLRLFPGDVCPGCGFDHVIHVEVSPAERVSEHPDCDPRRRRHANNGVGRQATCLRPGCGRRIPAGKGPARYCSRPCKQEARRETYLSTSRPTPDSCGPPGTRPPSGPALPPCVQAPAALRMTRVRVTTAKRNVAETVIELAPDARPGKQVLDLPDGFVQRFMAAQEEWWLVQAALAQYLVPRPVGGPQGPIGRTERPGSGRGTSHPKGAA